jgi:diguanylate cyclase (GGDEF)-like protein/PAS domain S-box-containing protein
MFCTMHTDVVGTTDAEELAAYDGLPAEQTSRSTSDSARRRVLQKLACGSLFAGTVHAGLCPAHFREATLFGLFFAVVAILQLVWAAAILVRPSRPLLVLGAAGNLLTIGVWGVSRTIGIPFGPSPWRAEAVGLGDVFTSLVEAAVAVGAFHLLSTGMVGRRQRPRASAWLRQGARKVRHLLPEGSVLPDEVWAQRHKWIVAVLWLHAPGVLLFALARHEPLVASLIEASIVVVFGIAVSRLRDYRRTSTVVTSVGLLTCSALLVRLSGGAIEMHFHYFVMVGVITLYQDWWPFLVAIAYVVLQHGLAGVIEPSAVYDHRSAITHPWTWAGIHGLFILGMSSAGIASWRLNESFLTGVIERQEQLEEAQEVGRLGGWERNLITGKAAWSTEFYRLLGLEPAAVVPGPSAFFACIHPDDRAAVEAGLAATWESGNPYAADVRIIRADGIHWLHCRAKATAFAEGRPSAVAGTIQEITERKEAEASLRETLSLLGATLDATADGILVVDSEGKITSFNQRFAELWRLPEEILDTRDDDKALAFVVGQVADPDAFVAKVRELYSRPEAESQDLIEFRDGRTFERFSTPQRVGGTTVGRVWSFRDITERKRLERELSHQAFHDSLTNLANQALFRDRVDHALVRAARHGTCVGVLFLDLDNFKTVNDSLGHTTGDELLIAVAERLRACLRATDTAARLGGDEFAVLIEDVQAEAEVIRTAERMIGALQQPFQPSGREIFISASVGIAFGGLGSNSDQLLRNGDLAMYTAKRRGKGCFETYHAEMHATAVDRLEMEVDLRRALTSGQLQIEYQPIFTLDTRQMVGVEALVRWEHPDKGTLAPAVFIPVAEETGLIREIGRQVLMEACAQARQWQLEFPRAAGLSVSVNVSPHQLHHDDLIGHVKLALASSGLPAPSLVLEFTETAMMRDTEGTIRKLLELKALGVRLAIDDFGTGYSSLSYLERFPVDILKIDQAFVSGIEPGNQTSSLASAIVSLSRVLGLQAVAEGIETQAQADTLTRLGCGLAQGFHFSRPIAPEAVARLLSGPAESALTEVGRPRPQGMPAPGGLKRTPAGR